MHFPLLVVLELLVKRREGRGRRNVRVYVGFLFNAVDAAGELYRLNKASCRLRCSSGIDECRNFRAGTEHSGGQGGQRILAGRRGGWRAGWDKAYERLTVLQPAKTAHQNEVSTDSQTIVSRFQFAVGTGTNFEPRLPPGPER